MTSYESYWRPLERLLAVVLVVLLGLRFTLPLGLTAGYVVALALIPIWLPVALRYRNAPLVFGLGAATALGGCVLAFFTTEDHAFDRTSAGVSLMLLIGTLAGAGVLLWARTILRTGWVAVAFGAGMLLGVSPTSSLFAENPWKFGFSAGTTVLALGLASLTGRRWPEVVALLGLAVAAGLNDARSSFAILLLTLLAVLWQARPRGKRSSSALATVVAVGGMAFVVYSFGQALILDGYLGEDTQQRSLRQVETSGSILLGSRPEIGATLALMAFRPFGYGVGIQPSLTDIAVAKQGMAGLGYDPNNGYVEEYMFGTRFEVHSVIGDLWADFGLLGLLYAAVLIVVVLTNFSRLVARSAAPGIVAYTVVLVGWNLPFSPLYSSVPSLILMLGLMLAPEEGTPWPDVANRTDSVAVP